MTKANSNEITSELIDRMLTDPKVDSRSMRYMQACIDGEKQAELYLQELWRIPDLIGMPLMASYIKEP